MGNISWVGWVSSGVQDSLDLNQGSVYLRTESLLAIRTGHGLVAVHTWRSRDEANGDQIHTKCMSERPRLSFNSEFHLLNKPHLSDQF